MLELLALHLLHGEVVQEQQNRLNRLDVTDSCVCVLEDGVEVTTESGREGTKKTLEVTSSGECSQ